MRQRLPLVALVFALVAGLAAPASANVVESAAATLVCNPQGGSLLVSGTDLTIGDDYTINYSFTLVPPSGPASAISGFAHVTPTDSQGDFSAIIPLSGAPTGDWTATGSLYLFNNTTNTKGSCASSITLPNGDCFVSVNGGSSTTLNCPAPACTAGVSITGSMEGNLPVKTGDTLKAGFDFTIPGSHPADTVTISNAGVSLPVQCPNGTSTTLTVTIPTQTITVPANNSNWFPSGDQSSPLVYQGSITVPAICGGATGHAPQGATFKASLSATTTNSVHVRFHYSDNTSGSWSSTQSYCH